MPTIAIVGVGAIGGVLAGALETASAHLITLCTRKPLAHLAVDTPDGIVVVRARNITDPADATPVDWIFCATKTYDNATAATWFPGLSGPNTKLAVIQNGVEHRENFSGRFAPERILPVVIDVPAERRSPSDILQRARAHIRVEDSPLGASFASLFVHSRAEVVLTADFLSASWHKLCINSAGVVSALTLRPAGVLRDEALGETALGIIGECIAVGRAEGAQLDDALAAQILSNCRKGSPDSVNSLLADRIAGRQTEIDTHNGAIVRLGAKHGIPTPLNTMAVALLKGMMAGGTAC